MRRLFRKSVLVVCMALASASVPASAFEVTRETIRDLMEEFGFVDTFRDFGEHMGQKALNTFSTQAPPDIAKAAARIFVEQFDGERLLTRMEGALVGGMSSEDIDALRAFAASPLGVYINAVEKAATEEAARQSRRNDRAKLLARFEKDSERAVIIDRIDSALHLSELNGTELYNEAYGITFGMIGDVDAETKLKFKQEFDRSKDAIFAYARDNTRVFFTSTYEKVSIEDMNAYADFLESDAAKQMYGLITSVCGEFLKEAGENAGLRIGELIRQKRS